MTKLIDIPHEIIYELIMKSDPIIYIKLAPFNKIDNKGST